MKFTIFYTLALALTQLATHFVHGTGLGTDYEDTISNREELEDFHNSNQTIPFDSLQKYRTKLTQEYSAAHGLTNPSSKPSAVQLQYNVPFTQEFLNQMNNPQTAAKFTTIIQPVSFVITYMNDGTGRVPYEKLQRQIDVLNEAFSGAEAKQAKYPNFKDTKIRFKLAGVRYIKNNDLFNLCTLPSVISKYRPVYMMDGTRHLNIYVCWCKNNLGLSWLPYDPWYRDPLSEGHYSLGAIVHHDLLPGNTFNGGLWTKGNILTHECGHTYGLKHPYEGDCAGTERDSDGIDDTPRQSGNPLKKCSELRNRDTCKTKAGKDDISNYMGATGCQNHFTPGQVVFMQNIIMKYKPTLVRQELPDAVAAITDLDNSPDLQPCIKGTLKKKTITVSVLKGSGSSAKTVKTKKVSMVCNTDPNNNKIWAVACVPSGPNWYEDECRMGIPNFNF